MRQINLPVYGIIAGPTDATARRGVLHDQRQARDNVKMVLAGAQTVEMCVEEIIADYFVRGDSELRTKFKDVVLSTGSFTFFMKWKALREILKEIGVPKNIDRSGLITGVKDTISYRNAFVHGKLIARGGDTYLRYYEEKIKEVNLSEDQYWNKLEKTICDTWVMLTKVQDRNVALIEQGVMSDDHHANSRYPLTWGKWKLRKGKKNG